MSSLLKQAFFFGSLIFGALSMPSSYEYQNLKKQVRRYLENADERSDEEGDIPAALIRTVFHDCGTYGTGEKSGCHGCLLKPCRVPGGCAYDDPENRGLEQTSAIIVKLYSQYGVADYGLTLADFEILCGNVAVEYTSDGEITDIPFYMGRSECGGDYSFPGALPNAADPNGKVEAMRVFDRLGFNQKETVALIGAHTMGRCEIKNSGFVNPWVNHPDRFSNRYFKFMVEKEWYRSRNRAGNVQFGDEETTEDSDYMMLFADVAFAYDTDGNDCNPNTDDNGCAPGSQYDLVQQYADDEDKWYQDFVQAWVKLSRKTDDDLVLVSYNARVRNYYKYAYGLGGLLAVGFLGAGFKNMMSRRIGVAADAESSEMDFETKSELEVPDLETVVMHGVTSGSQM